MCDQRGLWSVFASAQFYVLVGHSVAEDINLPQVDKARLWPRGYKTVFMLNSAEHEICFAYKS